MHLSHYLATMPFSHLRTFSCLRATDKPDYKTTLLADITKLGLIIQRLEKQKKRAADELEVSETNQIIADLNDQITDLQRFLQLEDARFINEGIINTTAIEVFACTSQDAFAQTLTTIAQQPIEDDIMTMCWPVYRDAIVFYDDKNNRLGVLQICFSCYSLIGGDNEHIAADIELFQALEKLLVSVGHKIYQNDFLK